MKRDGRKGPRRDHRRDGKGRPPRHGENHKSGHKKPDHKKHGGKPGHGKGPERTRDGFKPRTDNRDRDHRSHRGDRPDRGERRPRREFRPQARKIRADLWGFHAVSAAWINPERRIRAFYASEHGLASLEAAIVEGHRLGLKRPDPEIVDRHDFDRRLPGAVHQGLAVEADPLPEIFVADLVARAALKDKTVLLILDQVTDPHNIGAIMRSASAFGADAIIMQTRHAPEITGVLAKAASGAVEHMPIAYETNLTRALEQLQEAGFKGFALDERGDVDLTEVKAPPKSVLVLGAEGKGLRQGLREQCDAVVRLPTGGPVSSLNVSNAAAVALYALTAQTE